MVAGLNEKKKLEADFINSMQFCKIIFGKGWLETDF